MIRIDNLKKTFISPEADHVALDGVTLAIPTGDIFGLIGKSGAGKTTLLRILAQLEVPNEGYIDVDGIRIAGDGKTHAEDVKRQLGIVFQNYDLLMQKTVGENIAFPLKIRNVPATVRMRKVNDLLRLVGLSDKKRAYPAQLSGGQKQRVAIARALASDPSSLLLDEPTSALDSLTTQSILSLLKEINETRGVTIIVITHEIGVVRALCRHVAVLDEGHIAESGTVSAVLTHPQSGITKLLLGAKEGLSHGTLQ